jgi:Zn-dependent protease with chaperone function
MDAASFFGSYAGMYVTQSLVHAFIAAIITDRAIDAWEVRSSSIVQRFRLIVVILPIVSFPLYQLLNPDRASIGFRLQALFDSQRWLSVELWGKVPISAIFVFILALTALLFLVQELIPVALHTWAAKRSLPSHGGHSDPFLREALETLPGEKPPIMLIDDDDHVVFSTAGSNSAIFLSSGLLKALTAEELRAAVAHEIAHVARNRRPLLAGVFLLRTLMFFNPVTLLEFRKIVHEEEKICDDAAVALTGNRRALAVTLRKLYQKSPPLELSHLFKPAQLRESLEEHGHHVLLDDRIRRLEEEPCGDHGNQWPTFLLTIATIGVLNYFVV